MRSAIRKVLSLCVFVSLIAFLSLPSLAAEKVLHSFIMVPRGSNPEAALISDASGNLYGTTIAGGGYGVVFELSPSQNGGWTEKILHTFSGNEYTGPDGAYPQASLIFDPAGNIYGTTTEGGIYGGGIVFELSLTSSGSWKENIIHAFEGYQSDGSYPVANLTIDKAGNLYGTTVYGGNSDACGGDGFSEPCGTVFELSPSDGQWNETILHSFQGNSDGCDPVGGLIFDQAGNLYGTSESSGGEGYACGFGPGTVFELSPGSNGEWAETIIYAFTNPDDTGYSSASLIFDSAGNLYGTASGTAFELSPGTNGSWTESRLISLGSFSDAALIFDSAGDLYGTTQYGGTSTACWEGCGTIFELLSGGSNSWTENILYNFTNGSDGASPRAALLFDSNGNLLTTATGGGTVGCANPNLVTPPGCGTVVKLTSSGGTWTANALYDFPSPTGGNDPLSNLISDSAGNLYGTTKYGGTGQCYTGSVACGTVFELSPTSDGGWKTKTIHNFSGPTGDGQNPAGPVTMDQAGNLYGATLGGFGNNGCTPPDCGTVFELSPMPDGSWKETVLYAFGQYAGIPLGALAIDKQGSLYGTTQQESGGQIVQFVRGSNGSWQENVLYTFTNGNPGAGLVIDSEGDLYGVFGEYPDYGGVYKLSHETAAWTLTTLYSFHKYDGDGPTGTLTFDDEGNIYGVTYGGGPYNQGVAYELTPESGGTWNETVLHVFVGLNGDGGQPVAGLVLDGSGNLYGNTPLGGIDGGGCNGVGCGTAFELTPSGNGQWQERILHRFTGGRDGGQPEAGFIFGLGGNLYSTTSAGGIANQGTVFEIGP
jgi:hypothetical protein